MSNIRDIIIPPASNFLESIEDYLQRSGGSKFPDIELDGYSFDDRNRSSQGAGGDASRSGVVDLRRMGVISAVRNQGSCTNCTSHGFAAIFESFYLANTAEEIELAPSWMHICLAQTSCSNAVWDSNLARLLPGQLLPIAAQGQDPWEWNQCDVTGVYPTPPFDVVLGQQAIYETVDSGRPVMVGMFVGMEFLDWRGGSVYSHDLDAPGYQHAVCIVGFDDARQCWIAKNSYGEYWGDAGYFDVAYGTCGIGVQYLGYATLY